MLRYTITTLLIAAAMMAIGCDSDGFGIAGGNGQSWEVTVNVEGLAELGKLESPVLDEDGQPVAMRGAVNVYLYFGAGAATLEDAGMFGSDPLASSGGSDSAEDNETTTESPSTTSPGTGPSGPSP